MMNHMLGRGNREPSGQTEEDIGLHVYTTEERGRRRERMAEQAESRHTAQMLRGIGSPAKVLGKAHNAAGTFRAARETTGEGDLAEVERVPPGAARSPCGPDEESTGNSEDWQIVGLDTDSPSDEREDAWGEEAYSQEMPEIEAVAKALEASLEGVTYLVRFLRPDAAGGEAAGHVISLSLDALAILGDVQAIVEVEMFGSAGLEPVFLTFNGQYVPADVPIHYLGISEGDTVIVDAIGPFDSDSDDSEDDPVLRWSLN